MNIKDIINNYKEYSNLYYMNNQNLIDNYYDYKIAENIANKEYKEMEEKKYE